MDANIEDADVIVVGGGGAAFSAAHAARERSRSVVLLERAPESESGGNSYYTAGATRVTHGGLEDLSTFVEYDPRHSSTVVPPYSAAEFTDDLRRVTEGRNDPSLTKVLTEESGATMRWLADKGMRFRLMYERQAYERPDGSYLFWGGLHVGNVDGGIGLMADHKRIARRAGVDVRYEHEVTGLVTREGAVVGVRYRHPDGTPGQLNAESVIVASGGFEANPEMRERYLGPGWASAKLRGTPYNRGELLVAMIDAGAAKGGDWGSCHSVAWDAFAPNNESNRELTNRLTRQSYPLGIVVNGNGDRFLDEGADFRNYTYAKYGREILQQPGSVAYQVFDADLRRLLRSEEYDMPGVSVFTAESLTELAGKASIPAERLIATIGQFNGSIDKSVAFDPTVKDGRSATVAPPKSNWAWPIEKSPYYAYAVTCAITFTFGGVKGDTSGRVLRQDGSAIPGLYAVGEALGGLFSGNYPGGSGLTAGMVFGRRAGQVA